jgi:hypothetical protein
MNFAVFVTFVTVASLVTGFIAESQIITVLNVSLSTSKHDAGGEIEFAVGLCNSCNSCILVNITKYFHNPDLALHLWRKSSRASNQNKDIYREGIMCSPVYASAKAKRLPLGTDGTPILAS